MPELLAPCGSPEALDAAIAGGADAVYLGGALHNARMYAKNFDDAAMIRAITRCHDRRVAVYVTLNTQIYDREMADALHYAEFLYEAGADALIVADLGLASLLHARLPALPLHASTQLSGHNAQAASTLASLGFSRMVCAREMSRGDIVRLCAESPIEIEQFVHGAHCASHSGQCLMSAVLGGRSGNRGACAQPCRLSYNRAYPLSLKDLCLAAHLTDVVASGVASLKIEGRMKHPEYVYGVTALYRRLLNEGRNATEREVQSLSRLFSRGGGFTDGYYVKKITPAMLGVRTDADKAQTRATARTSFAPMPRPVTGEVASARVLPACEPFVLSRQRPPQLPEKQSARFADVAQIPAHHPFSCVYLPLFVYDRLSEAQKRRANGVILPPVLYDCDLDAAREALARAKAAGVTHVLCGNIGQIALAQQSGLCIVIDFRANVCNRYSLAQWKALGADEVILSPELILPQMRDIGGTAIVYGRLPLMLLERRLGVASLCDRKGVRFPVLSEARVPSGVRDVVYNSVPIYMADRATALSEAHLSQVHFIFTVESPEQVRATLCAYAQATPPTVPVRRLGSFLGKKV